MIIQGGWKRKGNTRFSIQAFETGPRSIAPGGDNSFRQTCAVFEKKKKNTEKTCEPLYESKGGGKVLSVGEKCPFPLRLTGSIESSARKRTVR